MSINLEKAKEEFIKYVDNYDLSNDNISRKKYHSMRVMEISEKIAKKQGLNQEKVELATIIGLLHDIARFEQYTQYKTFSDLDSFDHGDYGVEILKEDIRKYIATSQYDEIIMKAIKNHNKFEIEKGLTEEELFFAKLVRDADKTDIIYEGTELFWKNQDKEIANAKISEEVYNQFLSNNQIKREKGKKYQYKDGIIGVIAFIFDINFKETFEIIKENNYINKIIDRFEYKEDKEKMEKIKEIANKYIEEKG